MKLRIYLLVIVFVCFFVPVLKAQRGDEALEKLMTATLPNKNHAVLANFVGHWKQDYIRSDGKDESASNGKSMNEMVFDGRFLEIKSQQNISDQFVLSLQYIGFSIPEKKYFIFGIDGVGTGYQFATGDWNEKKKELFFKGTQTDAVTEKPVPFTITIRLERENKFIYEVYSGEPGHMYKSLYIMNIKKDEE